MAKTPVETGLYFNEVTAFDTGAVQFGGHLYAMDEAKTKLTRVMRYKNGQWGFIADVPGIVSGLGVEMEPEPRGYAMTREGAVYVFGAAGQTRESIDIENNGYLFGLRKIGAHWYACGSQHMVFRREGKAWKHFDEGVFVPRVKTVDRQFFSIDGSSEEDIYAVGAGGAIAHFDGKTWKQVESPTNYDLNVALCVSKDDVVVAGNNGTWFRGSVRGWRRVSEPDYEGDFTGLAAFDGKVYACTLRELWTSDTKGAALVEHRLKGEPAFYRLWAAGPHLWATSGKEEVFHFDGKKWETILCPENRKKD